MPVIAVVPPVVVAAVSTGKFCRLFAPASESGAASLTVMPLLARSMPSPVLLKMLLPEMRTPDTGVVVTMMPSPVL